MEELILAPEITLEKKIEQSIKILKMCPTSDVELCYSGGKDSDVILELAKMAGISFRPIYKKTTIDPAGTIAHCRENGVEVVEPKMTFFQIIENAGFPSRFYRVCCNHLKEYKILDNSIQGIRRCESIKRAKTYKEPIICRMYGSKKNHVNVFLPILEWTNEDVAEFINMRGIRCHPLYYCNGEFDVTKRLGCMGCPLKSDKGLQDFKDHPKLVKAWIRARQKRWENNYNDKNGKLFNDAYEQFAYHLFFDTYDDFKNAKSGLFGDVDFKDKLERYFDIDL